MVHLVTKKGIACTVGNSRSESTFEVTTKTKACTCPQCQNTQVFKDALVLEKEPTVDISLRASQYKVLKQAIEWAANGFEKDRPNLGELEDLTQELEYQEKS